VLRAVALKDLRAAIWLLRSAYKMVRTASVGERWLRSCWLPGGEPPGGLEYDLWADALDAKIYSSWQPFIGFRAYLVDPSPKTGW